MEDDRPFVGRNELLAEFDQTLDRARRGRGTAFLLAGEPGSGKSRCLHEFMARAENAGALVLSGHCLEQAQGAPFRPWIQILTDISESASTLERTRLFGPESELIAQLVGEEPIQAPEGDESGVALMGQRHALFKSVSSAIQALATRETVLLTIDDLHSADNSSLALLSFTANELRKHRVVIVVAYRDTEVKPQSAALSTLSSLARQSAVRYRLGGLSENSTKQLLETLLGETLPSRWQRTLFQQTSGNPLFVTEIARAIAQARAQSGSAPLHIDIPLGIKEAISRQLNALPNECQQLLFYSAVLGRDVDVSIVAELAGLDIKSTLKALQPALSREILESNSISGDTLRFRHSMFNETLNLTMGQAERVLTHQRIADLLEERSPSIEGSILQEIAHHRLSSVAVGNRDSSVSIAMQAADQCESLLAFEEAERLYESALEVLGPEGSWVDSRGTRAYLRRARIAILQARYPHALTQIILATRSARSLGDPILFARSIVELVCVTSHSAQKDTPALLEEALTQLRNSNASAQIIALVRAHQPFANCQSCSQAETQALIDDAIEEAKACGEPEVLAKAYRYGVMALRHWPESLQQRLAYGEEMLRLANEITDIRERLELNYWSLLDKLAAGTGNDVTQSSQRYLRLAERFHSARHVFQAKSLHGCVELFKGTWETASASIHEASLLQVGGDEAYDFKNSIYGIQMFVLQRERGELPKLAEHLDSSSTPSSSTWKPGLLGLCLEAGRLELARQIYEQLAKGQFSSLARDEVWLPSVYFCAQACWIFKDRERAALLRKDLMPWQGQLAFHPPAAVLGAVDSILALLATLTNQNKDARLHVESSLQLLSKNEAWPLLARAQYEGAQALATIDAGAAAALLHESEALAQQLNMSALLNAIATQKQAGNQGYPDGLTERETEVLALLSLGRSNKDITKVLGISLSTTATHVRNILSKTGCANRTEAAAYALQHKILSPMD